MSFWFKRKILTLELKVSAEDVNKLYKHFIKLDSDGNGVVSKEEFLSSDSVAGNPLAMRLVEMIDADESGDINFSEFVAGLSVFSSKTSALNKLKCELFII